MKIGRNTHGEVCKWPRAPGSVGPTYGLPARRDCEKTTTIIRHGAVLNNTARRRNSFTTIHELVFFFLPVQPRYSTLGCINL